MLIMILMMLIMMMMRIMVMMEVLMMTICSNHPFQRIAHQHKLCMVDIILNH